MADIIINAKHQQRHDTEANWTSKNPVLLDGEMGFVTGTQKYKIGDGTSKWSTLAYHTSLTDTEKSKLDGIATGANKTTVDSALSSTSTNPVQNKVINTALSGKANTNHSHDLSTMINGLGEATATPSDADYFVSQYAGGGTTNTSYFRRPVSALWNFIKSKLATVAISGSYNDLSNKPSIPSVGNGTVTIKQNGASKGSFTMNQSGSTTIELTDNNTNTWRDVVNNLTSDSTDKSLSAAQGKWLNENKATNTILTNQNLNDIKTPGFYSAGGGNTVSNKPSAVEHFGLEVIHKASGDYYTQIIYTDDKSYRRECINATWKSWREEKITDTVYTHPNYTAKSSGFYKVTVDSTGHVSGTTAVTKGDITALGIPSTNTTYPTGTASTSGITKLYTGTGTATDGTMTQSAIKSALDGKSNTGHTHKRIAFVGSDTANTNGWYKVADQTFSGYGDSNVLFAVTSTFGLYYTGILSLQMRSDNTSISCQRLSWLSRCGFPAGDVIINISGMKMTMYAQQRTPQYGRIQFEILSESSISDSSSKLVLYNSNIKESSTPTATKTATDGATVSYANSAGSVAWGNVSGKPSTFTPAAHTHNYAGSGSAGGSANSAAKLDTSTAGSTTQPVYFSGGKPVACSHTLGKSVPSNAVFTDTNTWRGIQNNLSSTSTSDSLSAYQGKLLNEKIKNRILFQSSEPTTQSENDVWIKTTKL